MARSPVSTPVQLDALVEQRFPLRPAQVASRPPSGMRQDDNSVERGAQAGSLQCSQADHGPLQGFTVVLHLRLLSSS